MKSTAKFRQSAKFDFLEKQRGFLEALSFIKLARNSEAKVNKIFNLKYSIMPIQWTPIQWTFLRILSSIKIPIQWTFFFIFKEINPSPFKMFALKVPAQSASGEIVPYF
jgi:hypothetical protein